MSGQAALCRSNLNMHTAAGIIVVYSFSVWPWKQLYQNIVFFRINTKISVCKYTECILLNPIMCELTLNSIRLKVLDF